MIVVLHENRKSIVDQKVQLEISKEEAIVLFEYLARVHDNDSLSTTFESQAEQIVLWNLQAAFEKILTEPFEKDYKKIVRHSRNSLIGEIDTVKKT